MKRVSSIVPGPNGRGFRFTPEYLAKMGGPIECIPAEPAEEAPYRHELWNRDNYPRFIVNNGPWDICANEDGYCAAIPTPEAAKRGHLASHYGNLAYVRVTLGVEC